ncbi:MAG TPA: hypothetical protein VF691_00085 [Cytophagaceae bacterium]|jgi:hypothetical protein
MKTKLLLMLGMVLFFVERGVGQCPVDALAIGELNEPNETVYSLHIPFKETNKYTSFTIQYGEDGDPNKYLESYIHLGDGLFKEKRTGLTRRLWFPNTFIYYPDIKKVSVLAKPLFYVQFIDSSKVDKIICTLEKDFSKALGTNSQILYQQDWVFYDSARKIFLLKDERLKLLANNYIITDVRGLTTLNSKVNNSDQLDVSSLNNGIFFLQVFDLSGFAIYRTKFFFH